MRTFRFTFDIVCSSQGDADLDQVENMIDLALQNLVFDDSFIQALDEKEAVTIQVNLVK